MTILQHKSTQLKRTHILMNKFGRSQNVLYYRVWLYIVYKRRYGSSKNDVTQFWTIFDIPSPIVTLLSPKTLVLWSQNLWHPPQGLDVIYGWPFSTFNFLTPRFYLVKLNFIGEKLIKPQICFVFHIIRNHCNLQSFR